MPRKRDIVRPVIMCGGSGTRLWPASRETLPKQFAPIIGRKSTFQETLLRVQDPDIFGRPVVIANRAHRFMIERQMAEIGIACDILLEPVARDSGPAIIASSLFVAATDPDALVLILAADHMVTDPIGFRVAVNAGREAAQHGSIVTFGIVPTNPATGYGYIAPGDLLQGDSAARKVARFVEKPDAATALTYISSGYLWNSGNFLFQPRVVIDEYEASDAAGGDGASVSAIRDAFAHAKHENGCPVLDEAAFLRARKISFDYAVMEKTTRAAVVAGDFGWSDIGGWDALWAISDKDDAGNFAHGDIQFFETRNSYASSENQFVAMLGLTDTVVVATRDAVLVADKSRSGEVRRIVETLKAQGRTEGSHHARVFQPWGWHEILAQGPAFQVRRIVTLAGKSAVMPAQHGGIRHWTAVQGAAVAVLEASRHALAAGQSIDIPDGTTCRIDNTGAQDFELIETLTGTLSGG